MNMNLLPQAYGIESQQQILKELYMIPERLMELKVKIDEHTAVTTEIETNINKQMLELEKAQARATESPEFAGLKNDTQRKAYILDQTKQFEQELVETRNTKIIFETKILPVRSDYEILCKKLNAMRAMSEQIAAMLRYLAAGEQQ